MVAVQALNPTLAGAVLARAGVRDPRGVNTPQAIALGGQCLTVNVPDLGACVLVVRRDADTLWVDGAASLAGQGIAPFLGLVAEAAARELGCARVRFETERLGFLRLGRARGWRVVEVLPYARPAFVMEKEI